MVERATLGRFTAVLIAIIGTTALVAAGVRGGAPAEVVATRAVVIPPVSVDAPVVASSSGDEQAATSTNTSPAAPTTTATPPATTPPTTTPSVSAPPTTVPPPTTAPTPTTAAPAPAPAASFTACEREMFDHMNEARTSRGIEALLGDGRVVPISRNWSDELARRQDLQHNPDYGPQTFAAVPEARRAAENVGRTHGTNAGLFRAFMNSPGHRDAILEPGHTHAGIGCTVDPGGQLWVTVNFWG